MFNSRRKHATFVVYDGIENSVFESQVLHPLLTQLKQNSNLQITLVSFEKKRPPTDFIIKTIPAHERLHFVLCRRLPFFGNISLKLATFQFKKLLKIATFNHITARGPLAGHVVLHALKKLARKKDHKHHEKLPSVIIQARGLCAEEYRYSLKEIPANFFKKMYHKFLYTQLNNLETTVYGKATKNIMPTNINIEAVSPALKDYLATAFHANQTKITIATKDLPKSFSPEQIASWRHEVRTELNIPKDAIVYCYSGSFKAWQCVHETIAAFSFEYFRNQKCFMLVLTKDQEPFKKELMRYKIPATNYHIKTVTAQNLYRYLAAGDYGMLLREKDIINWVSRPTKMLEYEAVRLKIIHNNTIGWLANK